MVNKLLLAFAIFGPILVLQVCYAPPVTKDKSKSDDEAQPQEEAPTDGLENYMEYHRYLRQVVNTLESDVDFRQKLESANETDISSGRIADQLEFVSHHVRTRLDELKRTELQRLKDLRQQQEHFDMVDHSNGNHHLDENNPHTFEVDDLKKLIIKTTQDLAEADKKRRNEFKEYEMQKEFERQDRLNHTNNGEEREKLQKQYEAMEQKHKTHEKLHEPGHKAQLEEVWEEQDHMQQDFNPKAFFMLHDLDSNNLWDQDEVKALFIKELDKMYKEGVPEDDMRERVEEMERMREAVFGEMDLNRDGFIDFHEFMLQTQRKEFQRDDGWQALDEQKPYSPEELNQYIQHHNMPPPYPNQGYGHPPPHYLNTNEVYANGGGHAPPGAYGGQPHPAQIQQQQQYQQQQYPNVHPGQPHHQQPQQANNQNAMPPMHQPPQQQPIYNNQIPQQVANKNAGQQVQYAAPSQGQAQHVPNVAQQQVYNVQQQQPAQNANAPQANNIVKPQQRQGSAEVKRV